MEDGDYSPAVPNVAVPVALAYIYPLGYGARSVWANEGGRGGVHSAHGDQRGRGRANRCRAGAPRRGFVVRRRLVDHGCTGCTGDRDKYTEGWSWLPLSRLSRTVPRCSIDLAKPCRGARGASNLFLFGQHEARPLASYWSIGIP